MEQQSQIAVINRNIPQNFSRTLPPVLQAALTTSGKVQSVEEVVSLRSEPKLAMLKKEGGDVATYNAVRALLVSMSVSLHIGNGLSEQNINDIARRLTTDSEITYWLTLADVDLLCRNIVAGKYGPYYNRFGEDTFNECLVKYCNERNAVHHLLADKKVVAEPEVLAEVGYKVDAHGNIIVKEKKKLKGIKSQHRYIYDENGNIKGENAAFWGQFRKEKSRDEMAKINKSNRVMELTHALMKADPTLGYLKAIELAAEEVEKEEKEALEKEVTT